MARWGEDEKWVRGCGGQGRVGGKARTEGGVLNS